MKISESFAGVATSATRVIEMYYPEDKRLFNDQFVYKLLPFGWRVFLRLFYLPGLRSLVSPRWYATQIANFGYNISSAWGKNAMPVRLSLFSYERGLYNYKENVSRYFR